MNCASNLVATIQLLIMSSFRHRDLKVNVINSHSSLQEWASFESPTTGRLSGSILFHHKRHSGDLCYCRSQQQLHWTISNESYATLQLGILQLPRQHLSNSQIVQLCIPLYNTLLILYHVLPKAWSFVMSRHKSH